MSQSDKLPILKAVQYSWRFAATAALPTFPAFLLKAVADGAVMATGTGDASSAAGLYFVSLILSLGLGVACSTMALRLALRGEFSGFIGLRFGPDEIRLLGAQTLFAFLMILTTVISGLLVSTVVSSVVINALPNIEALQGDQDGLEAALAAFFTTPAGIMVSVFSALLVLLPLLWVISRLITFQPATIARGKIMIFETWSWTKGLTMQVLLSVVIACAPFAVLSTVIFGVMLSGFGLNFLTLTPEQLQDLSRAQGFVLGAVVAMLNVPLSLVGSGLATFMYRGFDPQQGQADAKT